MDIGNTIGVFVKVSEKTKLRRHTTFTMICLYMDISQDLPDGIEFSWEDEDWLQPIDYEKIPFECRGCHENGHLAQNFPRNLGSKAKNTWTGKDEDNHKRAPRKGSRTIPTQRNEQKTQTINPQPKLTTTTSVVDGQMVPVGME